MIKRIISIIFSFSLIYSCKTTQLVKEESVIPVNPFQYTGYVIRDNINIRSLGSTSAEKVGTVMDGDEVQVLQNIDGWYEIITTNNQRGWIRCDFIGPKSLSYWIKMAAFVENFVKDTGAEIFIDENKPYAVVYLVLQGNKYADKNQVESLARNIGKSYQKEVYPGSVEIRILNQDKQKLFAKVNLSKKGAINLKAPLLKTGRTYDFKIQNGNEIIIQALIPGGLSDNTLLDMCNEISINYGDEVRKIEIYFAENSSEGKLVFTQDGYKPKEQTVCRFYYLEDSQGPDYKTNFCN